MLYLLVSLFCVRQFIDTRPSVFLVEFDLPFVHTVVDVALDSNDPERRRRLSYSPFRLPGEPMYPLPTLIVEDEKCRVSYWRYPAQVLSVIPDPSDEHQRLFTEGLRRWCENPSHKSVVGLFSHDRKTLLAEIDDHIGLDVIIEQVGPPNSFSKRMPDELWLQYDFVDSRENIMKDGVEMTKFTRLNILVQRGKAVLADNDVELIRSSELQPEYRRPG